MIRHVAILCLVLFTFISIVYAATAPPDIVYKGKTKANVIYRHQSHIKKNKCEDCHPKNYKQKKFETKFTMAHITEKKACGTCHDGKISFGVKDCQKCHIPSQKPATNKKCPGDCDKCNKCD